MHPGHVLWVITKVILLYLGVGSVLALGFAYLHAFFSNKPWFSPAQVERWLTGSDMMFSPLGVIWLWPIAIFIFGAMAGVEAYVKMMERAAEALIKKAEQQKKDRQQGGPKRV
jgi:hypothetical protein